METKTAIRIFSMSFGASTVSAYVWATDKNTLMACVMTAVSVFNFCVILYKTEKI